MAKLHPSRVCLALCFLGAFLSLTPAVLAIDIEGAQGVSFDQPRVNVALRWTPAGDPLTAYVEGISTFNIQAFLDTGASGILLSKETSDYLGVTKATIDGSIDSPLVTFEDVGVAGSALFHVSNSLYAAIAPSNAIDIDNPGTQLAVYNQVFGAIRTQISPETSSIPMLQGLDIVGMPTMAGKVVVMDPKPLEAFPDFDLMHTFIYDPDTPYTGNAASPGIPTTSHHVELSYGDFERFTVVTPSGAEGPAFSHNPFIGPNPVASIDPSLPAGDTPGITVAFGGASAEGSFLLDTGAQMSMISTSLADQLNVRYVAGTEGTEAPQLELYDPLSPSSPGTLIEDQFQASIGGIGGVTAVAGFNLDSLLVPTMEDDGFNFLDAPVLVFDITVKDLLTDDTITLDGIFGMNFMVASANISTLEIRAGAFNWVVFDEPNGILGLDLKTDLIPEPGTFVLLAFGASVFLLRRIVRRRAA
ncbi:MAG: PEP-CTERM sorting domain-containing protein [Pirellulales bacterium]|nr:PEP-CTERM sorting domain-containing protein [Pirellulales bacterium]